jgi:hypothetical protein
MTSIRDHASVLRSKNASPYTVTLDIIFDSKTNYEIAKQSDLFSRDAVADAYGITPDEVNDVIYYEPANAVKVCLDRTIVSGHIGDTDVYGAQQYAPLLSIDFPTDEQSNS